MRGLEGGADDYVASRFRRSCWRPACAHCSNEKAAPVHRSEQLGKLSVNELRREVMVENKPIDLTPKEYELLIYF